MPYADSEDPGLCALFLHILFLLLLYAQDCNVFEYVDCERTGDYSLQVTTVDHVSAQGTSTLMTQDRAILYLENVCAVSITHLAWPVTCVLLDILVMLST